jgi:hypothetical protein
MHEVVPATRSKFQAVEQAEKLGKSTPLTDRSSIRIALCMISWYINLIDNSGLWQMLRWDNATSDHHALQYTVRSRLAIVTIFGNKQTPMTTCSMLS